VQIVRFRMGGRTRYGALDGGAVVEYTGTPWSLFRRGRRRYPLRQVVLLAPVMPSKIVGIGLNHREHAVALGRNVPDEPAMFFKPVSALIGPDDPIVMPPRCGHLECEPTLGVVIKRRCRSVPAARAREYVLGYAVVNDVTARDVQARDGDWTRAKAFDTFCPVGPCIATDLDPNTATIETWVNGVLRRAGSTKELIFGMEDVLARVSDVVTLLPGDVVTTGTPGASGRVEPGDRVEIRVEGVGGLKNTIVRL
jgi:2-keto-4-pentenoate hydratase/2-oxohepta-3-ene-1,7-dioic acid hydratase in catechol pathway